MEQRGVWVLSSTWWHGHLPPKSNPGPRGAKGRTRRPRVSPPPGTPPPHARRAAQSKKGRLKSRPPGSRVGPAVNPEADSTSTRRTFSAIHATRLQHSPNGFTLPWAQPLAPGPPGGPRPSTPRKRPRRSNGPSAKGREAPRPPSRTLQGPVGNPTQSTPCLVCSLFPPSSRHWTKPSPPPPLRALSGVLMVSARPSEGPPRGGVGFRCHGRHHGQGSHAGMEIGGALTGFRAPKYQGRRSEERGARGYQCPAWAFYW